MHMVYYWGLGKGGQGKWFLALATLSKIGAKRRMAALDRKGYITKIISGG